MRFANKFIALALSLSLIVGLCACNLFAWAADTAPVLWYSFDSGAITDQVGDKDAALYGSSDLNGAGVYGNSLLLKGGYAHMPEDIIYGFKDISVACWVNPQRSVENQRIWSLGDDTANLLNLQSPCNEGGLRLGTALRNDSNPTRVGSNKGQLPVNQWSYVVVTYSQSDNKTLRLYVDGVEVGAKATGKLISALPKLSRAYLGRSQWSADPDFYGYIDEFKIYDITLSADEILAEAQKGFQQLAENTLESLDLAAENGLTSLEGVVDNLHLPSAVNGVAVSWATDNAAVLSNAGKVSRVDAPTKVTLTATATKGEKSQTKIFSVTVVPEGEITVDPVEAIRTVPGRKPELPKKVMANGGKRALAVNWTAPTPNDYATAGTFTVSGVTAKGNVPVSVTVNVDGDALVNPVVEATAPDPHVIYHEGYYYYTRQSNNNKVTVSKAKRLQDLGTAPRVVVYTAPDSGMYSREYWAPELHYIDGNWYIYVAADDGNNANHRMYVLRSTDPTDPQAPYENLGKITPTKYDAATDSWVVDSAQDKWAIDGTVLQDMVSGRNYFVWSGWEGNVDGMQITYIAEMLNPWTLKGSRVELSRPDSGWDQKGHGEEGGLELNEGQQIVYHGDKVYIYYSANFSGSNWYCLGQITATLGTDLTDKNNWVKNTDGPVFTQSLDPDDRTYGVGHATIVQSPDGSEDWLIYHAFQNSGGGWVDRSARAQKLTWDGDTLVFGNPVGYGDIIDGPSGTPEVTVYKYEAEEAVLSGNASVLDRGRASGGKAVTGLNASGSVAFNVNIRQGGEYLLTFKGNSYNVVGFNAVQNLTVGEDKYTISYSASNQDQDTWHTSYDATAATRGQGLVVYLPAGETTITLSGNNTTVDVDCLVLTAEKLDAPVIPDAESVTITAAAETVEIGGTVQLTAEVKPADAEQTVIWSVDDDSIATVDQNGLVTAIAAGKVIVTATAGEVTATVEITVTTPAEAPLMGDVDFSKTVDVADIMKLKALIMADKWSEEELRIGDMDGSKSLDVGDIMAIKNIIMSK